MLDGITNLFTENLVPIASYILFPILIALVIFVIIELYVGRKGTAPPTGFHSKSFLLSTLIVFGWLILFLIPADLYLPLEALSVRFVYSLFMIILTMQYAVFVGTEVVSESKTIISLGIGAGLIRSTLAVSVMAPKCAEDESLSFSGATAVMLANTVAVLRNFTIIAIVGFWLGLYTYPPIYFIAPMLTMLAVSGIVTYVNYRQGMGAEEAQFKTISLFGIVMFMVLFLVMYYLALGILDYASSVGLYGLSAAAGFLYGAAHLFIIATLWFSEKITLQVGLFAAIFVTAGAILSDIPYSFFMGAKKLTKILIISEIIPVVAGLLVLFYFLP